MSSPGRRNVILTGFMGAGKTTVGRAYANQFQIPFADTDAMIEKEAGITISQIFKTVGEEDFRRMETSVLQKLLKDKQEKIISAGGGLPLRKENQSLLKQLGIVALLSIKPETALKRLLGDDSRPLLCGPDAKERIENLLYRREPIYRKTADIILEADDREALKIAVELAERIKKFR